MAYLQIFQDEHSKIGYKKEDTIVVECIYDEGEMSFGKSRYSNKPYGVVLKANKCGIIDVNGKEVIPCEYDEIRYLFSDLFAVRRNLSEYTEESSFGGKNYPKQDGWEYGVINSRQEIVIPFEYKFIERINNMICCYKEAFSSRKYDFQVLDGYGNVYDYKGCKDEHIFNSEFKLISSDHVLYGQSDYLVISKEEKAGVIDCNGQEILSCKYDEIICAGEDRFIVRINNDNQWSFGVVNSKEESIIPFEFRYIESEFGSFFHCYKQCSCEVKRWEPIDKRYEYSELGQDECRNRNGKILVNGDFHALNADYIVHAKNGKTGLYNQNGVRILNYIYDEIDLLSDYFIIRIEDKIGVLDHNGSLIINCSYNRIECVCPNNKKYGGIYSADSFGNYNPENIFDTSNPNGKLHHVEITNKRFNANHIYVNDSESFDFKKTFILDSGNYCELFTVEDGILNNSRYDKIQLLTEISFAVCKKGKWGVYRSDVKEEIIPCIHDRLQFQGFHTTLLNIGNLWGAKTLVLPSHPLFIIFDTDIPIQYLEIEPLNSGERLFSVKRERKNYKDELYTDFTIVGQDGEELPGMSRICREFDSHFKYYTDSLVLAKYDNKYGFINLNGYICIPFKYDEIEDREDESFNVRIEENWGVLHRDGKELPAIKYADKLPQNFDGCIVKDQISDCFGILNASGEEDIPTVYEHLEIPERNKNIIFFGFGGCIDNIKNNFFSNISYGTWGCLRKSGEKIIDAKYDCFKLQGKYILGGRDGFMLGEGHLGLNESEYSGVYDLFDSDGTLLIGGFREFKLDTFHNLFMFKFGGYWRQDCEDYDEWGNPIFDYSYYFEKGNSRWLIVDHDFKSIMLQKNGEKKSFLHHLGTITKNKEKGRTVNYWNMPLELFSVNEPRFDMGYMICGDDSEQFIVRISDGTRSLKYRRIEMINQKQFFYTSSNDNNLVGIAELSEDTSSDDKLIIDAVYEDTFALSHPINGYVFGMSHIDDNTCKVVLYNIYSPEDSPKVAISNIDYSDLIRMIRKDYFRLYQEEQNTEHLGVAVIKKEIFDEEFQKIVNEVNNKEVGNTSISNYWYSEDYILQEYDDEDGCRDYQDDDQEDYMRDTWDAMTDGMYGDMPDGFDGDFSFLGYD